MLWSEPLSGARVSGVLWLWALGAEGSRFRTFRILALQGVMPDGAGLSDIVQAQGCEQLV